MEFRRRGAERERTLQFVVWAGIEGKIALRKPGLKKELAPSREQPSNCTAINTEAGNPKSNLVNQRHLVATTLTHVRRQPREIAWGCRIYEK